MNASNSSVPPSQQQSDGWFTRERLLALLLLVATGIALFLCGRLLLPFLPALAWALALSVIAAPVHHWIAVRVANASVAAGLTVAIVAIGVVAPVVVVSQQLVKETGEFVQTLKENGQADDPWKALADNNPSLAPALKWIEENLDIDAEIRRLATAAGPGLQSIVSGSTWVVFQFLVMLFVLFYAFRDRQTALRGLRSLVPLSEGECDDVCRRIADTIHATIYGSVVVALVQGTMGGLMFWWLGLPAPMVWGAVMGLLALVPYLGTFVIWGPVAAYLALDGRMGSALLLTAWGGIAIALVDNLLYPVLVGQRLRMHPVPVFFAVIGGVGYFGAAGLVLGPVILAITIAIMDIWRRRTAYGQPAETAAGVAGTAPTVVVR